MNAAGMSQRANEIVADRVGRDGKDDRDVQCRLLSGQCGRGSRRDNDIDFEPGEFAGNFLKALCPSLGPAILYRDRATLDPPEVVQPLHKSGNPLALG